MNSLGRRTHGPPGGLADAVAGKRSLEACGEERLYSPHFCISLAQ